MNRIEQLQEKIKNYQDRNSFTLFNPKFTDKYEREYTIACYQRTQDKKNYLRVSTALCCLQTPDLQTWSAKKSFEHQTKAKAEGASVGRAVHTMVEGLFKGKPVPLDLALEQACHENEIKPDKELEDEVRCAYEGFLILKEKTKMEFVASEVTFHSDTLHVAGTLDLLVLMDGKLHNVDLKTGTEKSGAKIRAAQSAYKFCVEEHLNEKILCTIFGLEKSLNSKGEMKQPWHFTYRNYDMSLRVFLGQLSTVQDHWYKELGMFWPHWKENLLGVEHQKVHTACEEFENNDVKEEELAIARTENQ